MSAQHVISQVVNAVKQQQADQAGITSTVINISDFTDPQTNSPQRNLTLLRRTLGRAGLVAGLFSTRQTEDGQYELRAAPLGA